MTDESSTPVYVNFDYLKSPQFRTIHVDGAIGAPTPNGNLHVAIYSERLAIPQRVFHEMKPSGQLGDRVENMTVTRGGIVRELEADLIFSVSAAENFAKWLLDQIDIINGSNEEGE